MPTILRITLSLALAAIAAAVLAAPAAAAPPRSFYGMQDWKAPTEKTFNRLGANGIGSYRAQLNWAEVEHQPGLRNWGPYDGLMVRAAKANVRVLPVLLGSPPWAAPRAQTPPATVAGRLAFMRFARDAAARYGPGGTFWAAHPDLRPQLAVNYWQVWNEPNIPVYWFDHPNAGEYVEFLREVRAAVQSAQPTAKMVLAGLPNSRSGIHSHLFLRQIYAIPGAEDLFDVVTVHPYAKDALGVLGGIKRVRRVMRNAGDPYTPIWITEIGWATGGNASPFTTTERGQAKRLRSALRSILRVRKSQRIGMVVWFSLRDRRPTGDEKNWWALNTGLYRKNGTSKPAWRVLVRYSRR